MTSALIVIDMQNDFCLPSAGLFVAQAPQVIPRVQEAVSAFRAAGLPVVIVMRQHRADGSDVDRSRRQLFAERPFLVRSPGVDLVDGLAVQPGDYTVFKRRWSAFFDTDLDSLLRRLGVDRLYLCGVQTPNCIRTTACDANARDYECVVLSDATGSANQAVQDANLYDLSNMGIEVLTTAEAITDVTGSAERVSPVLAQLDAVRGRIAQRLPGGMLSRSSADALNEAREERANER